MVHLAILRLQMLVKKGKMIPLASIHAIINLLLLC